MKIEDAYQVCETIIRENSRSFYTAYKDLPLEKRQAVFAVYAFCRKVDDAIDDHHDLDELMIYERWLDAIKADQTIDDPVYLALKDSVHRFKLDLVPFYDLITGQKMDLGFTQPKDESGLLKYCYHVASTVGLMLLPILSEKHHNELHPTAVVLGYAMQITNILRDIGEDADMGRIYLPQDDMTSEIHRALKTKTPNPAFIALWEKWALKAEAYYEEAADQLGWFDEVSRLPLLQSLVYYKAILNAVRNARYDCLSKRQSVKDFLGLQSEIKHRLRKVQTHE